MIVVQGKKILPLVLPVGVDGIKISLAGPTPMSKLLKAETTHLREATGRFLVCLKRSLGLDGILVVLGDSRGMFCSAYSLVCNIFWSSALAFRTRACPIPRSKCQLAPKMAPMYAWLKSSSM